MNIFEFSQFSTLASTMSDDILNMVPQYVLIANTVRAKNRFGEIINSFMTEVPII